MLTLTVVNPLSWIRSSLPILVPSDVQVETRMISVIMNIVQVVTLDPHKNYKLQLYYSLTLATHY
jgi:hypothetical protein